MANLRKSKTTSGKELIAGKSAESNEELVAQVKPNEYVLHTVKPGSPFTNIKADEKETTKEDLQDAAVFCAKYSQDWRDNKKDVKVHYFLGKDIYKTKDMSTGTFGIKKFKEILVKKQDILNFEKGLANN